MASYLNWVYHDRYLPSNDEQQNLKNDRIRPISANFPANLVNLKKDTCMMSLPFIDEGVLCNVNIKVVKIKDHSTSMYKNDMYVCVRHLGPFIVQGSTVPRMSR